MESEVYKVKETAKSTHQCLSNYDTPEQKEENHILKLSRWKTEISSQGSKRTLSEAFLCNDKDSSSTPVQSFKNLHETYKSSRYSLPETSKSSLHYHESRKSGGFEHHSLHRSWTQQGSTDQTPNSPPAKHQGRVLLHYRKTGTSSPGPRKRTLSEVFLCTDKESPSTPVQGLKKHHETYKSSRYSLPETSRRPLDYYDRQKNIRFEPRSLHQSLQSWTQQCSTDQTPYSPSAKRQRTILPRYNLWNLISFKSISFIDTHCHLDFLFQRQDYVGTYKSYQKLHKDTYPESYEGCIAVFCNPFTFAEHMWKDLIDEENVWGALGCHPHNSEDYSDEIEESLIDALGTSKVIALGEIGLDYSSRNKCRKKVQHEVFERQLQIVKTFKLPLVIHCREAHEDCLRIIKNIIPDDYYIHLHCFTDTWDWAKEWLDAFPNLFIGITNVVTFPSAESVHDVVKRIPLDRLLLETDAPYFVPKQIGRATRWSHPGMAIHVAGQIAALREIPVGEVLKFARQNTRKLYNV